MEYLRFEINESLSQRRALEERWIRYERMYRAIPDVQVKEFPFLGAANLVLPVIATDVDTIYSRLMGILFATENLWSCKPLNDHMIQFAARLQEFLQWAQHNELGVYQAVADWVLEMTKLGTGVLKQRYRREQKRVYQFRETEMGSVEEFLTILLHDHPVLEHVSLWDFLVPATATDVQSAAWCSERIGLSWGQLMSRARSGIYQNVETLSRWRGQRGLDSSQLLYTMQQNDLYQPSAFADRYDVWETWLDYDISGVGEPQSLVCTIHLPSMTYLRIDYNPFFNQEKPYSVARYLRQPKRFYGVGVAEMLEHFQEEVTAMHNQRLDNATLANSSMFKARKGIGIKDDEPIFPGRWFLLDDMEDVQPMAMGTRFDSTVPYEQQTLMYAQKRTGVNDYISGDFSPAMGYSTATVGVQQLKESAKRFDQTLREVRIALGESGTRIVELYQQFNLHGKEYLAMGQADGAMVHQVLQFPLDMIRAGVGVELTATSAALNKEVEVRTNTIVMQMMTQFYQQAMQGLSYVINPQVPPPIRMMAWNMVNGQNILMRRLLDSYGIQDIDRLLPELEGVLNGGQQQLGAVQQAFTGGPAQPAGLLPPPSMGAVPQGFGGAAAGFPAAA